MSTRTAQTTTVALAALGVALAVFVQACADERVEAPDLLPIGAEEVAVNETLRLPLTVNNPAGVPLEFLVDGPELPGLEEVSDISGGASGGEFRWTPLASHVGTHSFTFTASSSAGQDSESVLITVTPAQSAAPVFLRPGAGGTFDLSRDRCVRFDIDVRDDDSSTVDIGFHGEPIEHAQLFPIGPKQADFEWCPTPEQSEQADRWTVGLQADDGDHDPTQHDYLIVLRTNAREDCPGEPPIVDVIQPAAEERVTSPSGYTVAIEILDDRGIRDAPLLYYTTVKPEDTADPDVTTFEQTTFSSQGPRWVAVVPPFGLAAGDERRVYYVASVRDNDDPNGTACDHRVDTPLGEFIAVGASGEERAAECELCTQSSICETGICAAGGGGTCLPSCSGPASCEAGACVPTVTIEGATVDACGDAVSYCSGEVPDLCDDDDLEDNDTRGAAVAIAAGTTAATFCGDDPDFYSYTANAEGEVTVVLNNFDFAVADLDLELLTSAGLRLGLSESFDAAEEVSTCVAGGDTIIARVFSVADDDSDYDLSVAEVAGPCCINDGDEPDGTLAEARPVDAGGNFAGTICPADVDHVWFDVDGPSFISALLVFVDDEADLDMELWGPSGSLITGEYSTTDDELIEVTVADAGRYVLRVKVYGDGSTDYIGQVQVDPLEACFDTIEDCPIGSMCDADLCVSDLCNTDFDCPFDHICPVAGPAGAQRHCVPYCEFNGDCRDEGSVEEACKRFVEGTGCGRKGSGANGVGCDNFTQCGGQRACLDWPGGYCARAGCTRDQDCESDTFCADVDGLTACVRRCGGAEPPCRLDEGYTCAGIEDVDGDLQAACIPE